MVDACLVVNIECYALIILLYCVMMFFYSTMFRYPQTREQNYLSKCMPIVDTKL